MSAVALMFGLVVQNAHALDCGTATRPVAIDVGHSRRDPGAISARGETEFEFNRRFAAELEMSSGARGLHFITMNRGEPLRLSERPARAKRAGAGAFLSIHHDSVNTKYLRLWTHGDASRPYSDAFSGFSLFVYRDARFEESSRLARAIGEELRTAGFRPTLHHAENIPGENRLLIDPRIGLYEAPFAVLRSGVLPSVLFEVGVIANRDEETRLSDPRVRAAMHGAVARAVSRFCGVALKS